jgi:hypothetical protein
VERGSQRGERVPASSFDADDVAAAKALQARKVRRTIRHIDPWSLLKVSLLFHLAGTIVLLIAAAVLFVVLSAAGIVGTIEDFFTDVFALDSFEFHSGRLLRFGVLTALVVTAVGTVVTSLLGLVFNLVSDIVGGVTVSVVEEESTRPVRLPGPGVG